MRARLDRWALGHLITKIDEEGVHVVKNKANSNDVGNVSRPYRWGALIDSNLHNKYGVNEPVPTQRDKCVTIGLDADSAEFYSAAGATHTLPKEFFDSILNEDGQHTFP